MAQQGGNVDTDPDQLRSCFLRLVSGGAPCTGQGPGEYTPALGRHSAPTRQAPLGPLLSQAGALGKGLLTLLPLTPPLAPCTGGRSTPAVESLPGPLPPSQVWDLTQAPTC